jgi:hypothetical protein
MDTTREILILLLRRIHDFEKARRSDLPQLVAAVRTIRSLSPEARERFDSELAQLETKAGDPVLALDDIYDGLIDLLRDPDPSAEDEQERLRRLLESFEGPQQ